MSEITAVADEPALSGRAWVRTLAAAWFAQFAAMTGFSFAMPFLPFYLRQLGVHDEAAQRYWAGFVMSAPALTMMVTAPLWGVLADRVGRKVMVMRAMLGGGVVIALMGAAGSPGMLLLLRLIQGAITGTVSATNALVSGVTPRERVGTSLGLITTAIFAGSSVGPLLGGMCADAFGYSATFFIAGGALVVGGIVVAALADEGHTHPRANHKGHARSGDRLWSVLAKPGFAAVVGLALLLQFAGTVLSPIFPLYVESLLGSTLAVNTVTGRLFAITAVCAACVAVPLGWVADRVGPRRVLVLGTLLSGVFLIPQAFVTELRTLYVLRVALGFAVGAIGPALGGFVNRAVPRSSQGTAFGIVQSATSLGFGLGPITGGAMGALCGLRAPFVLVGAIQMLCALAAWWVLRKVKAGRPIEKPAAAEYRTLPVADQAE
jgi:DHA1 family multidrug resistance protein-like MFS transporter